jgi:hypothetical protein
MTKALPDAAYLSICKFLLPRILVGSGVSILRPVIAIATMRVIHAQRSTEPDCARDRPAFRSVTKRIYSQPITPLHRVEVYTLLSLLDELPRELIDLSSSDYLDFQRCRAVLATALSRWSAGDGQPVRDVGQRDPVERVRRLMALCHDQLPPKPPELPVMEGQSRFGIEELIQAAWTDFDALEWMGATVFAGTAIEALLLWAIIHRIAKDQHKKPPEQLYFSDLIDMAGKHNFISADNKQQLQLAKSARNLMHPGAVLRSGSTCDKATALTALAGVYRTISDLSAWPDRTTTGAA